MKRIYNPYTKDIVLADISQKDIEQWFHDNRLLLKIFHTPERPVIPKMGGYWMLGEYHTFTHKDHICVMCGNEFPAHITNKVMCFNCFIPWKREYDTISNKDSDLRFKAKLNKRKEDQAEKQRQHQINTVGLQTKLF